MAKGCISKALIRTICSINHDLKNLLQKEHVKKTLLTITITYGNKIMSQVKAVLVLLSTCVQVIHTISKYTTRDIV